MDVEFFESVVRDDVVFDDEVVLNVVSYCFLVEKKVKFLWVVFDGGVVFVVSLEFKFGFGFKV